VEALRTDRSSLDQYRLSEELVDRLFPHAEVAAAPRVAERSMPSGRSLRS
jgi:hypothetical protein